MNNDRRNLPPLPEPSAAVEALTTSGKIVRGYVSSEGTHIFFNAYGGMRYGAGKRCEEIMVWRPLPVDEERM